ncbi:MAG: phosphodiester glycosidase family protein [Desulfovermiculus sp.]|nr:phosphodiester glycosidase family protein [Desulfovermiculus sp.]
MRSWGNTGLTLLCFLGVFFWISSISQAQTQAEKGWQCIHPGLWHQVFEPKLPSGEGRMSIPVLKINPGKYDFHLLTGSENGEENKTLPQWMEAYNLHAAINASMFWKDQSTSTGFMRNFTHVNNDYLHPKYEGFLVFHPMHPSLPQIQIVDREHDSNWREILDQYGTVVQSFRMISVRGENVWEQNTKRYSVASVGITHAGEVLFIFCQTPTTIHDLNKALLQLPLDIKACMFVEGGPTAGLVVDIDNAFKGWKGTSENFLWPEVSSSFVRLPNVIGITPKNKDTVCSGKQ